MENQDRRCRWCGTTVGPFEGHHLYRRGTHPGIKNNKEVVVDLCVRCHWRATNEREFEVTLQRAFLPEPPKSKPKNEL